MRGKIVKVGYFKKQGWEVFLEKLRSQRWLELFTNTQLGCSQPDLAEFHARVTVTKGTVTSVVNGVQIEFDAPTLDLTCMSGRTSPCLTRQGYWT